RRAPHQFDFFQAVRLLGYLARSRGLPPVGDDVPAEQEAVRFRTLPSLSFPASTVAGLKENGTPEKPGSFEVGISFFGLVGPQGVLPYHYTRTILDRVRARDRSFRDFLDLFHHRLVELFARAWEKYRLPFTFERIHLATQGRQADPVTQVLACLVGFG